MNKIKTLMVVTGLALVVAMGVKAANEGSVAISASYNKAGISLGVTKNFSLNIGDTNVNSIPFNCGTMDSTVATATPITNGWLIIINNSPTNQNYIKYGNSTSNYFGIVKPQEAIAVRFFPGADSLLHVASSNGSQAGLSFWLPN